VQSADEVEHFLKEKRRPIRGSAGAFLLSVQRAWLSIEGDFSPRRVAIGVDHRERGLIDAVYTAG
jgi:hypothetical protein